MALLVQLWALSAGCMHTRAHPYAHPCTSLSAPVHPGGCAGVRAAVGLGVAMPRVYSKRRRVQVYREPVVLSDAAYQADSLPQRPPPALGHGAEAHQRVRPPELLDRALAELPVNVLHGSPRRCGKWLGQAHRTLGQDVETRAPPTTPPGGTVSTSQGNTPVTPLYPSLLLPWFHLQVPGLGSLPRATSTPLPSRTGNGSSSPTPCRLSGPAARSTVQRRAGPAAASPASTRPQ